MVKEISNNITRDKNRTIFAFIRAVNTCNLPKAALKRVSQFK